mgnify:CR=1 FL=1|jgi:hypothetical protein
MDETLIHAIPLSEVESQYVQPDIITAFNDDELNVSNDIAVYIRPYLNEFLMEVKKEWQICIFTASD